MVWEIRLVPYHKGTHYTVKENLMKKAFSTLLSVFAVLFISFLFVPSSDTYAANGPSTSKFSLSYISVNSEESLESTIIFAAEGYTPSYNQNKGKVEGISYNEKTNTLTLKNASVFNLYVNDMGDDFKIKLSGDNKVYSIKGIVISHSLNMTFIGDGTLTLGMYKDPGITLDAEGKSSFISFEDSVTVNFEHHNDFMSGVSVISTTAKDPIRIGKDLKCLGSVKKEASSYYDFDLNLVQMVTYADKKDKRYGLLKEYTTDYNGTYYDVYLDGKKVEGNFTFDDIMNKGYRIVGKPDGSQNYYLGSVSDFEISPNVKETIAAPKASVKVSDKSAKIKVKKTKDAEGYTVSYIRSYENDMTTEGIVEAITKDFKKPGKKAQTLTVKNLAPGAYMATVTPYKTVKGEKVYGSESNAVYFHIK